MKVGKILFLVDLWLDVCLIGSERMERYGWMVTMTTTDRTLPHGPSRFAPTSAA